MRSPVDPTVFTDLKISVLMNCLRMEQLVLLFLMENKNENLLTIYRDNFPRRERLAGPENQWRTIKEN